MNAPLPGPLRLVDQDGDSMETQEVLGFGAPTIAIGVYQTTDGETDEAHCNLNLNQANQLRDWLTTFITNHAKEPTDG